MVCEGKKRGSGRRVENIGNGKLSKLQFSLTFCCGEDEVSSR
jgi:hypothetical protein